MFSSAGSWLVTQCLLGLCVYASVAVCTPVGFLFYGVEDVLGVEMAEGHPCAKGLCSKARLYGLV